MGRSDIEQYTVTIISNLEESIESKENGFIRSKRSQSKLWTDSGN